MQYGMDNQISELASTLYDKGAGVEEQLIHQINYLWYEHRTLESMPRIHELINDLEEEIGEEYEENIEIMRECVSVEEERLRTIEEERMDKMRVFEVKRIMGPVLLDRLGEPGLVERIVEAMYDGWQNNSESY